MPPAKRPLDFFLKEEMAWERKAIVMLKESLSETDKILKALELKNGPGALQRGYQLRSAQIAMRTQLSELWTALGQSIQASREASAAAAIDAAYTNSVLQRVEGMTAARYEGIIKAERAGAKANVERSLQRLLGDGYVPLSERVYKSTPLVTGRVDRIVQQSLARGASAREMATAVRALINPNTPGGVKYAAMRLGRTENNNSFHARQVSYAQETPWVTGVKWQLSGSHPRPDECNDYDNQVYAPNEVPAKPHPNCLCYTTYEQMSFQEMWRDPASQSHIDDLMREAGYSNDFITASAA